MVIETTPLERQNWLPHNDDFNNGRFIQKLILLPVNRRFSLFQCIDSSRIPVTRLIQPVIFRFLTVFPLFFLFSPHVCKAEALYPVLPDQATTEYKKLIEITLSEKPDGVTGMKSMVYINAAPAMVWKVLTDYNNLKRYIPRMVESDLVADYGNLKVINLTGEFLVLFLKKTIRVSINMYEKFPLRIDYQQISGDFEVYRGAWILQRYSSKGTILTYESEIKPSFVAPSFILHGILKNDMVAGLTALKIEAERLQAIELQKSVETQK